MAELKIKRLLWARGGATKLFDPETGKMNVIGFAGDACGVSRGWMSGHTHLRHCYDLIQDRDTFGITARRCPRRAMSWLSIKAIAINDNPNISDEAREAALTALFASRGHTLTFED